MIEVLKSRRDRRLDGTSPTKRTDCPLPIPFKLRPWQLAADYESWFASMFPTKRTVIITFLHLLDTV